MDSIHRAQLDVADVATPNTLEDSPQVDIGPGLTGCNIFANAFQRMPNVTRLRVSNSLGIIQPVDIGVAYIVRTQSSQP
jgi:hypothetical protein